MSMTDRSTRIRNGIRRLYHQASKLNLYVQNANVLNTARVAAELKQLSNQLNELTIQQGGSISQEE